MANSVNSEATASHILSGFLNLISLVSPLNFRASAQGAGQTGLRTARTSDSHCKVYFNYYLTPSVKLPSSL